MTAVRHPATRRRPRPAAPAAIPYVNRELSWLDFNARVLYEASDQRNPLLERVRFLSIFSSNLDEFFQVRVAGLKQQVEAGHSKLAPDGRGAAETLSEVRRKVLDLVAEQTLAFGKVKEALVEQGIRIVRYDERPERHHELRRMFIDQIFPVLTPLAVDPGHPFPYISDLSLSLAVTVRDPETGERDFARIKVPEVLPRLVEVGVRTYILLEQIIAANLDLLPRHGRRAPPLRVSQRRPGDRGGRGGRPPAGHRGGLRRRRFGEAVRLEVERSMPAETRSILRRGLEVGPEDVYEISGMLDLRALETIADLDIPELQREPWHPVVPNRLLPHDEDEEADVFAVVRAGDLLVHHPYESFVGSVQRFIEQAANDPDVLTIKMTLYRTTGDSPILKALIRAAENGKQVVVLVEIKARFDEQANIVWGRTLERAGAHVVYGLVGLKTHSKTALVVRREGGGLRRYCHIGTGNYNHKTARLYVDLGILTCDGEIGADVTDLFNFLTGLSRQRHFRRLLIAPVSLRTRIEELIEGEIERQRSDGDGVITMKLNSLVDPGIIAALCRASQAGVPVDLIVRGGCALRPGVEGVSELIRVRSIIGPFLEHSRILRFGRGDRATHWIGSADMMDRNLDRRVEAVAPVLDPFNKARLDRILEVMLADDRRAWVLGSDERWQRVEWGMEAPTGLDTFEALKREALASSAPEDA
jgi:polyphosphate kinase